MEWHTLSKKELMSNLRSRDHGLKTTEAKSRISKYGKNEILEKKQTPKIIIFLRQFNNALIYILIFATIISYFFGHLIDMYVILAVILINSSIGYFQESKAEHSVRELKKLVVSYAKAYRDNKLVKIPAYALVPGDVITLEEGDRVPADAMLIKISRFSTNESSLTGESLPVEKLLKIFPEKTQLADRKNMVFMGTYVVSGTAKAIVTTTGKQTAIGKIASEIQKIKVTKSHFEKKSDHLAKQLGIVAIVTSIIIFFFGYFVRKMELSEIFLFTLASLVSVIPEGLPAVLAIVLAMGAYRMSRKKALIKKLSATENLGVVTTIITDKTGTITENTMNVEKIFIPGENEITVSGNGWEPEGTFLQNKKNINPLNNDKLSKLLKISIICNNSQIIEEPDNKKRYSIVGDPTEASLLVLAKKAGLKKEFFEKNIIDDLPFNQELKYRASLSTLVNNKEKREIYVLGSPESVLINSSYLLEENRKIIKKEAIKIQNKINEMAKNGMRVLAIAYQKVKSDTKEISEDLTKNLTFLGLVGIRDPPRVEVKEAISKAKQAGIRIIMATGDHKETGIAIARDIGLIKDNEKAYNGEELERMSKSDFSKAIRRCDIFTRLTPHMKLKIATELQKQKEIVAMTGDGINDAPALKKADIGISMGIMGTDVARESSDIILADDNFASIINAIEEGRTVFINTRQASSYLLTTHLAEAIIITTTLIANLPLPLLPVQILWLNLVTGGGSDVSLATEKTHHEVLKEPPRKASENVISKKMAPFLLTITLVIVAVSLFVFVLYLPNLEKARTMSFAAITLSELFNVFNMRSLNKSAFTIGLFTNKWVNITTIISLFLFFGVLFTPFLQGIFSLVPINIADFIIVVAFSSLVLIIGEVYKKMAINKNS